MKTRLALVALVAALPTIVGAQALNEPAEPTGAPDAGPYRMRLEVPGVRP